MSRSDRPAHAQNARILKSAIQWHAPDRVVQTIPECQVIFHPFGRVTLRLVCTRRLAFPHAAAASGRYHHFLFSLRTTGPLLVETPLQTDHDIRQRIWVELQRATHDRHHEWRTPVVATVGADGLPGARTVVLRHADVKSASLAFYTDSRSPKVAELQAAPQAALVFWSKRLSWQLRVSARVRVETAGPLLDAAWLRISQSPAAADYLSATAPGSPLCQPNNAPNPQHHLAILIAQVDILDWLELARTGHRRALLTPHCVQWCVP